MRITLDIDDDVLTAAKKLAKRDHKTAGKLVSELMREALAARVEPEAASKPKRDIYGFKPIPAGGYAVPNELVNELRDDMQEITLSVARCCAKSAVLFPY